MSTNQQPIFITGRFRSGTSFLWQLFNQLDGFCSWYEPLHPQLIACVEHVKPKKDHVGIEDYWTAYRQHPEYKSFYSNEFAIKKLHLEAGDNYPELAAYIAHLIELSGSEIAVLQFNRVDLRLSWLKANFPKAKIIHIERNPLQLYHSQRKHIKQQYKDTADYWDAYELVPWCFALNESFPFLLNNDHQHAFFRFYTIYLLSKIMAKVHADVSINLDVHVFQGDQFIELLSQVIDLTDTQKSEIKSLTHVPDLPVFSDELTDDLAAIMTAVELQLTDAGLMESFARKPLQQIKSEQSEYWRSDKLKSQQFDQLLLQINQLNSEMTRILAENDRLKSQVNSLQIIADQSESSKINE